MIGKRLIKDSLIISLGILLLTSLNFILSEALFNSNYGYIFLIDFIAVISFVIYGWLIRKWFIINKQDQGDNSLNYVFYYFLPIFAVVLIFTLIVNLSFLRSSIILIEISSSFLESTQISFFSLLIGIFFYTKIENNLGPLITKQLILPKENELGLRTVLKQTEYTIKKSWKLGMIVLGVMILISNFLVFIIYPSIPSEDILDTLTFTLPNFMYKYQAELGYRQDFFKIYDLPTAAIVDWKLAQSLMCLALIGIFILLVYLPKRSIEVKSDESVKETEIPLPEDNIENIAYNIISVQVQVDEYSPQKNKQKISEKRSQKLIKRIQASDLIPVMGLACLNIALATFIILVLLNMGVPITSQIEINVETLYVQLSKLYWAGFNEEISFRFILFGLPLFVINGLYFTFIKIYHRYLSKKEGEISNSRITGFLSKKKPVNPLYYLTGRWKKLSVIDFIVLVISSYLFGFAHYQIGYPYWQVGKIFQSAIAGLIFGYAFYKFGLHAAIFLHVVNNFVIGMILTPNLGLILNGEILVILITIFGAFYLIYVLIMPISSTFKLLKRLSRRTAVEKQHL